MHPGLKFDLLDAEIKAAHEIGVKTPVYLSAGFDEKIAHRASGNGSDGRKTTESDGNIQDFTSFA